MRLVKCVICEDDINRQTEAFVQINKRYAHEYCAAQENVDKEVRQNSHLPKHYACAEDIVKSIKKVKAFNKKRPSKRKVK
jgi:hypothetical protein